MLKSAFKIFVNFIISLTLFPLNLFILYKNIPFIKKKRNIFIQTAGGFGHTFTMNDIARHLFDSDFIYIWFFEEGRHNIEINRVFNNNSLIFRNNISIIFKKKKYTFGETEGSNLKFFERLLISIIKKIKKKNILINSDIYQFLINKFPNKINYSFPKDKHWIGVYYALKNNSNYKLNLDTFYNDKKIRKLNIDFIHYSKTRAKNICIYLRNQKRQEISGIIRDGSRPKEYYKLFKYLDEKNYNIFLVGDPIFHYEEISKISPRIIDCNFFSYKKKNILKIFFASIADNFISENGGGQYFGLYSKKLIYINYYPPFEYFNGSSVLLKNIYDRKKNRYLSDYEKRDLFFYNYIHQKRYKLSSNSDQQILNFVKLHLKK